MRRSVPSSTGRNRRRGQAQVPGLRGSRRRRRPRRGFRGFPFGFAGGAGRSRAGAAPVGGGQAATISSRQLFGDAFRTASGEGRRARPAKGEDVAASLTVTPGRGGAARPRSGSPCRPAATWTWSSRKAWPTARPSACAASGRARPASTRRRVLTINIAPHERFYAGRLRPAPAASGRDRRGGAGRPGPDPDPHRGCRDERFRRCTDSGRTFRLRGKGLPTKTGHGDLLVTVEIKLPEVVDEALMDYARRRKEAKAVSRGPKPDPKADRERSRSLPVRDERSALPPCDRVGLRSGLLTLTLPQRFR